MVGGRLTDSTLGFSTSNFKRPCHSAPNPKTVLPSATRMKRRFRIVLVRSKGEVLGTVEAADANAAEKVAAIQFKLDEQQRRRLLVQELAR